MTHEIFKKLAGTLPAQPGIYKYFDGEGQLLYVGKAKHLKKRISSYFNKKQSNFKTYELVKRIEKIEFTIVNSEQDAFFLENSLIKKFQPKYNIDLKDDKSYPFIIIKNEPFPRVFLTRKKTDDGSEYLGPYTSVQKVRELLTLVKQNIQLRTCTLPLTEKNIQKKKFKVCLEYHLGNCKGPCEGLQTAEDYQEGLKQLKNILKGNLAPVIRHFKEEMKQQVALLEFEKAELTRKKIEYLENYQAKSVVVSKRNADLDVFSIIRENDIAFVNYLMINNGTIVQTKTIRLETHLDESEEEILSFAADHLRSVFESKAREIIAPFVFTCAEPEILITVPKAGEKKKLLDLSLKNAGYFIGELREKKRLKLGEPGVSENHLLQQLKEDLKLPALPRHIECFDNSNFQGSYPVSAMVCFLDGKPSKKDYRHFNVKTVKGINDFASMKEAVYRRYKRLTDEGRELPQLIIIDGGKGQLSAALEAIEELNLSAKTTVVGLAKNMEEIFFAGDSEPLRLEYRNESLKLIRRIRDEVHRFGIRFHRTKRSKGTFKNELETIPGIGKETATLLLKEFRSVSGIRLQPEEKLIALVGKKKAGLLLDHFKNA